MKVWDLDSVDRAVRQQLNSHLSTPQHWDVFIGHFLGVDHAGHKFGPDHPEMARKLGEMDSVVEEVAARLPPDTVLLVFGDHGMTAAGDHGGDSQAELQVDLRVLNTRVRSSTNHHYPILFTGGSICLQPRTWTGSR